MRIILQWVKEISFGVQLSAEYRGSRVLMDYYQASKKKRLVIKSAADTDFYWHLEQHRTLIRDHLLEQGVPGPGTDRELELPEMGGADPDQPETGFLLYSDGGASPNPGAGAFAYVLIRPDGSRREEAGSSPETTNNRMELTAVIRGLEQVDPGAFVEVRTDSRYVQQGISSWINKWRSNDWRTASGGDVKNRDLWMELDALVAERRVRWTWVEGHSGEVENEHCDQMVQEARTRGEIILREKSLP